MAADGRTGRIGVVAAASDEVWAAELIHALRAAGFDVPDDNTPVDTAVVLLSSAALDDERWFEQATTPLVRCVPVRLEPFNDPRIPEQLRLINWIELSREAPATTWAVVMSALRSNLGLYRRVRQLSLEAAAWDQAGRPATLLVADHKRTKESTTLLAGLDNDPLLTPDDTTKAFVKLSRRHARGRRRASLARRGLVVGALIIVVALVVATVTQVNLLASRSRSAAVSAGIIAGERQFPDWIAVQSTGLLLSGDPQQRQLARQTLHRVMSRPWSLGEIAAEGRSVETAKPLASSSAAVAVLGTGEPTGVPVLAVYDLRTGQQVWSVDLGGAFWILDVGPSETVAAVVGPDGIALVDLEQRTLRVVPGSFDAFKARLVPDGSGVVIATYGGDLVHVALADGSVSPVGTYERVVDLRRTDDGGVRALVSDDDGHYQLVDALIGSVLGEATLTTPLIDAGAVAVDAVRAVAVGGDGQLWVIDAGQPARPTGIAVADRTEVVVALGDDRYAIDGQVEYARVVHLASGTDLGEVCMQVPPRLVLAEASADGNRLACIGGAVDEIAAIPPAPSQQAPANPSRAPTDNAGGVSVEAQGNKLRLVGTASDGTWLPVTTGDITAAAIAPDASRALVGSTRGEAVLVDLTGRQPEMLLEWVSPDGGPVLEVAWNPGPVVSTAAGWVWSVPDCEGCGTDAGLVDAVRARLSGCWTARQLHDVEAETRRRLDLHECRPYEEAP